MTATVVQSATGELIAAIGARDIDLALVRQLLEQGGDPNEGFSNGCTFLHVAASESSELAKLLLEHSADIEAKTTVSNYTPLMLAAMYNNIPALELLIEKGAMLDQKDTHGQTALDWANQRAHPEAAEVITNAIEQKAARDAAEARKKVTDAFHDTATKRQERLKNLRSKPKPRTP